MVHVLVIVFAAVVVGESAAAQRLVSVDSSGIRIASSSAVGAPTWVVEQPAHLEIGVVEGDEPYLFHGIRAAFQLADGRIVVPMA
jgi:hypothetical protein